MGNISFWLLIIFNLIYFLIIIIILLHDKIESVREDFKKIYE